MISSLFSFVKILSTNMISSINTRSARQGVKLICKTRKKIKSPKLSHLHEIVLKSDIKNCKTCIFTIIENYT